MPRLTGKVALVTGAAQGIGQGSAICLAEEGADLALNDLPPQPKHSPAGAEDTARQVAALGRRAMIHYADVSDAEQIAGLFKAAVDHFGRIDIVVANAALSIREPVIESIWEHVERTIAVTQFGVYHTCRAAARQMVRQGGGKIIIIGSILAEVPLVNSAPYNMAKAAVVQLCRTLAAELAPYRINVNVINPGWIDTPGERRFADEEEIRRGAAKIPWGRLGTPRDIGRGVCFLASDDADYITGSTLQIDGGYRVGMRLPE